MSKELLNRCDIPQESTWALEDIFADESSWEDSIKEVEEIGDSISEMEGSASESADSLYKCISLLEKASIIIDRVYNYAMCLSDQDTSDTDHQAMKAKAIAVYTSFAGKTSFLDPEIISIDSDRLEGFFTEKKELEKYRHFINESIRLKKYTLSKECEKLLAISQEALQASSETYSLLENADLAFPDVIDESGNATPLSNGRFVGLQTSSDRKVREETFKSYYAEFMKLSNTFASLYNGQVKSLIFNAQARGYENTLSAALIPNDVTASVYTNLVDAVNNGLDAMHSYVSLRKKLLGVDELHMYDIYVPMIAGFSKEITFEEAKKTALKALAPLGEDYVSVIQEGFNNRWIDVYENKGKRSGAYETVAYGYHPFVLLNFDGKLDDIFTVVHEMGHAMHSYYSNSAQPYFEAQYKIFVAEVASTCNELLLLNYLLDHSDNVDERKYLLNHYLDMFKGTLFRQTQFAEYELETNRIVENGGSLNKDVLCKTYLELNKKYYGPDMVNDDEISYEWARIPHFYYNFYVYQYATSFSASVALVNKILSNDADAISAYKAFLSAGCTKPPVELLKDAGVNLETSKPFDDAIEVMRSVVKELEELC